VFVFPALGKYCTVTVGVGIYGMGVADGMTDGEGVIDMSGVIDVVIAGVRVGDGVLVTAVEIVGAGVDVIVGVNVADAVASPKTVSPLLPMRNETV
jgi:hypothetical protein